MPTCLCIGWKSGSECAPKAKLVAGGRVQKQRWRSPPEILPSLKCNYSSTGFRSLKMGILLWIVFGLLAGGVARWIMPGPDRMGLIATIVLGVAGALLGGVIGSVFGSVGVMGFDFRSFLTAI